LENQIHPPNPEKSKDPANSNLSHENAKEQHMSLTELISTYYPEYNSYSLKKPQHDISEDHAEELDISLFLEDLRENVSLTKLTQANLEVFNSHIFYSDLYDILEDIRKTNEEYLHLVTDRDPDTSKYYLACFLEHVFKFLNELNESLIRGDTQNIKYLLGIVDDVYYNSYMEYYFRGYEDSLDEDHELNSFD